MAGVSLDEHRRFDEAVIDMLVELDCKPDATLLMGHNLRSRVRTWRVEGNVLVVVSVMVSEPPDRGESFWRWRVLWAGPVAARRVESAWDAVQELQDQTTRPLKFYRQLRRRSVFRTQVVSYPDNHFTFDPADQCISAP